MANRRASMFSAASLPRKWSILKIWDSANTSWTVALSSWADSRSVPNGFSITTRERSVSPASPSVRTIGPAADGGTDR